MASEAEIAWAAGLFEGEGWIAYYPKDERRKFTARYLRSREARKRAAVAG